MSKEEMILRGIDEIPMFTFNTKTKEFSVLGHKFEGVNSIEDFCNYIHNLDEENKQLKEKVEYLKNKIENKDNWCQLIADIGFDYDGYNQVNSLKSLIDELVQYALNSRDDYDYDEFIRGDK